MKVQDIKYLTFFTFCVDPDAKCHNKNVMIGVITFCVITFRVASAPFVALVIAISTI